MHARQVLWSAVAGGCAFVGGAGLLGLLGPVGDVLVTLLPADLDPGFGAVLLALPALAIGPLLWWAGVESRTSYTYLSGAAFGVATALGTVLWWLAVFAFVWGPSLVLSGWVLVAFVGVAAVPVGLLVGVSVLYARRRHRSRRRRGPSPGHPFR